MHGLPARESATPRLPRSGAAGEKEPAEAGSVLAPPALAGVGEGGPGGRDAVCDLALD